MKLIVKLRMYFRQKQIDRLGAIFLPLRRELSSLVGDLNAVKRHEVKMKLAKAQSTYNTLIDKQMADRSAIGKKEIVPGIYWGS